MDNRKRVSFTYKNHRGEVSIRLVIPDERGIEWGVPEWHPQPQWLLSAWDCNKEAQRTFAMKDITDWSPCP